MRIVKRLLAMAVLLAAWVLGPVGGGVTPAQAGLVTVVADVNAALTANFPLYDNVLGGATQVMFSRADEQQAAILGHYNATAGVTAFESAAALDAPTLANVDLLVVTRFYDAALDYGAAEIAAVAAFVAAGGSVLMIAEANANTAQLDGYNDFLAGIGSAIRYTGDRFGVFELVNPVETTALTVGVSTFGLGHYNTLDGGTAAVIASGGTVVAFEDVGATAVPEPAPLAALGLGLAGLGALRRRRAA